MGSIRDVLQRPVEERVETVEHDGATYTLKGKPSATLFSNTMLLPPAQLAAYARVFSSHAGETVSVEMARLVLLIHATLQHEEHEAPYDTSDIARLSAMDAPLFFRLAEGAARVIGADKLAQSESAADEALVQAAAGN